MIPFKACQCRFALLQQEIDTTGSHFSSLVTGQTSITFVNLSWKSIEFVRECIGRTTKNASIQVITKIHPGPCQIIYCNNTRPSAVDYNPQSLAIDQSSNGKCFPILRSKFSVLLICQIKKGLHPPPSKNMFARYRKNLIWILLQNLTIFLYLSLLPNSVLSKCNIRKIGTYVTNVKPSCDLEMLLRIQCKVPVYW